MIDWMQKTEFNGNERNGRVKLEGVIPKERFLFELEVNG